MDKSTKEKLLEKRIITPESRRLREMHNKESVPIIEGLENYEFYKDLKKFNINQTYKTDSNGKIYMPESLIREYLGMGKKERVTIDQIQNEFMFWYSGRGLETKMLLIPNHNWELLEKFDKAEKFGNYFENKEHNINIKRNQSGFYIIWGIPGNYTHPGRQINFFADNSFYIKLQKILEDKSK